MIYGYCRISRPQQNIERQQRNIKAEYPTAKLYCEAWTGTRQDRPEWIKLQKQLQKGDTVVFDSVSRMSRNATEGVKEYYDLFDRGVELIFLKEPLINTATYKQALSNNIAPVGNDIADIYIQATNKVLWLIAAKQIQLAFDQAEKEVTDLRQRTAEGIKTAKLNGKRVGTGKGDTLITRKSLESKLIIVKKAKAFGGAYIDRDLIKVLELAPNSYYKYKRELKADIEEYGADHVIDEITKKLQAKVKG